MKNEKAIGTFKYWMASKNHVSSKDNVTLKEFNKAQGLFSVVVNDKVIGSTKFNSKVNRFIGFRVSQKNMASKKEYSIQDYITCGKIKLMG